MIVGWPFAVGHITPSEVLAVLPCPAALKSRPIPGISMGHRLLLCGPLPGSQHGPCPTKKMVRRVPGRVCCLRKTTTRKAHHRSKSTMSGRWIVKTCGRVARVGSWSNFVPCRVGCYRPAYFLVVAPPLDLLFVLAEPADEPLLS